MSDTIRSWAVCLLPRAFCSWLWDLDVPLGRWAPFIFGRVLGADPKRVARTLRGPKRER